MFIHFYNIMNNTFGHQLLGTHTLRKTRWSYRENHCLLSLSGSLFSFKDFMCNLIMRAEILKCLVSQAMKSTSVSQNQHKCIRGFLAQSRDLSTARVALHYKNCDTVYHINILCSVYLLEGDILCVSEVVLKWFWVRTQMLH